MNPEERIGNSTLAATVAELGTHLDSLIKAYQDALDVFDSEKFFQTFHSDLGDRLVINPIARMFLEDHVRIIFISVTHELRRMRFMKFNRISESSVKKLNNYSEFMEQSSKLLFNRVRIRASIVVILVLITTASYFTGNPSDLTSIKGIVAWLLSIDIYNDSTFVFLIIFGALGISLFTSVFHSIAHNGFLPKRVIFSGGTIRTKYGDFLPEEVTRGGEKEENWKESPEQNIYTLENRIYEILRTKKPHEFPLDLFLGNWAMNFSFLLFLYISIFLFYGILYQIHHAVINFLLGSSVVFLSLLIWYSIKASKAFMKRKKHGNI